MKKRVLHFFSSHSKRSEVHEIREDLRSTSNTVKKYALRQTIASMTVGKDMSGLFSDVVNCMQSNNLEVKKLVYLYVNQYAKTQPDLAILAVNTFVKDASDYNPLIRALAVRTMSGIRLERVLEYLATPLRAALRDADPYVRKVACLAVAKVYESSPRLAREAGFVQTLQAMLTEDGNPMVLSNAVAALSSIARRAGTSAESQQVFRVDRSLLSRLLIALNECNEWGQVVLLEAVARYVPGDAREAQVILERVLPRLQHANSAVVLAAARVVRNVAASSPAVSSRKVLPAVLSLVSTRQPPEVVYVALRTLNAMAQLDRGSLPGHFRAFFCDFDDPPYLKQEKLEMLVLAAAAENYERVLPELMAYANEVDVELACTAVRAIGRIGLLVEAAADASMEALAGTVRQSAPHLTQAALVAVQELMRRYPGRYATATAVVQRLVAVSRSVDADTGQLELVPYEDVAARAALFWLLGECAPADALPLLRSVVSAAVGDGGFLGEAPAVQLQILTAAARLWLRDAKAGQAASPSGELLRQALASAVSGAEESLDVRDRALLYRRLWEEVSGLEAVLAAERPAVRAPEALWESEEVLRRWLSEIGSVASVIGLVWVHSADSPPDRFAGEGGSVDASEPVRGAASAPAPTPWGGMSASPPSRPLLSADRGRGLRITGGVVQEAPPKRRWALAMTLENLNVLPGASGFAVQLNRNVLGLVPAAPMQVRPPLLQAGDSATVVVPLEQRADHVDDAKGRVLQIAIKCSPLGVLYFADTVPPTLIFRGASGAMDRCRFLQEWNRGGAEELRQRVPWRRASSVEDARSRLLELRAGDEAGLLHVVAERRLDDGRAVQLFAVVGVGMQAVLLVELVVRGDESACEVGMRGRVSDACRRAFLESVGDCL